MCSCSAENRFDCIVTGGGHAGSEAAVALARLGLRVLLVSGNVDRLGYLSCNPAIGGLAKGHIVREIDALGGAMGLNTDATAIQFRMLNASKGPSVRAPRAQCDKTAYRARMKMVLETAPGIRLFQGDVVKLLVNGEQQVTGAVTSLDYTICARSVVICSGTFMQGLLHVGLQHITGGRMGCAPSSPRLAFKWNGLKRALPRASMEDPLTFPFVKCSPETRRRLCSVTVPATY